jgi:uncharacterized protein (TIGR00369 family)
MGSSSDIPREPRAAEGNERVRVRPRSRQRRATIAQTLDYDVVEAETGRVVITVLPNGSHLNPWGTVHGGLTATLLDSCMGLSVQSTLEKGLSSTTLEFKISLVRAITPETGEIRAEGRVLNAGRRIGTAEGRVIDKMGRLLAHGTTTCFIFEG